VRRINSEETKPNIIGAGLALAILVLGVVGLRKLAARDVRKRK